MFIGYHTLEDRDNADEIEQRGPFPSVGEQAFLGRGCYFWEEDIENAHWWGSVHYGDDYVICYGEIGDEKKHTLNLVSGVNDKKYLNELMVEFGPEVRRRYGTPDVPLCYLFEYMQVLEQRPQHTGVFSFKVIRSIDLNSESKVNYTPDRPNYTFIGGRQILCIIKDIRLILKDFRIVYPEKYVV